VFSLRTTAVILKANTQYPSFYSFLDENLQNFQKASKVLSFGTGERCNELMEEVLIIGDVHGCFEELQELIGQAGFSDKLQQVILVGDLVNKGPYSSWVVQWARTNNIKCVMGNHDHQILVNALTMGRISPEPDKPPFEGVNKPSDPSSPSWTTMYELSNEDLEFLRTLPLYLEFPDLDLIVTHAGLAPDVELKEQKPEHTMLMRDVVLPFNIVLEETPSDEQLKELVGTERSEHKDLKCVPWIETWNGGKTGKTTVVFGHDAMRRLQLRIDELAYGLDTGCCYGGFLTGIKFPQKELVQVKAKSTYSAGKKKMVDKS
jgi:diadenosine tetraphosphatase ApaH/serine/threonine PP2A family protein phosphatase